MELEHELHFVGLRKEADMATRSHGHHGSVVETGSTTDSKCELTDEQWEMIEDLFQSPEMKKINP